MYFYYAQVIGLCLNFLGGLLLSWYSLRSMSSAGCNETQPFEKELLPEFKGAKKVVPRWHLAFYGGFCVASGRNASRR